jgi:hypothetical protein
VDGKQERAVQKNTVSVGDKLKALRNTQTNLRKEEAVKSGTGDWAPKRYKPNENNADSKMSTGNPYDTAKEQNFNSRVKFGGTQRSEGGAGKFLPQKEQQKSANRPEASVPVIFWEINKIAKPIRADRIGDPGLSSVRGWAIP